MIEIRIHGRGGQGGVTLAKILAHAHHLEGKSVQAFGIYAAERSGAPLQAFLRFDDQPIHNPNQIYEPDHIIVLDPTLISPGVLSGLRPGGFVLLNSNRPPEAFAREKRVASFRIASVDASAIAIENRLGTKSVPIVNTALAGAMARLLGMGIDTTLTALREMGYHAGNLAAANRGFAAVRLMERTQEPASTAPIAVPRQRVAGLIDGNTGGRPSIQTGAWANQQPIWENATPPCNFVCPAGNDVQGFLATLAKDDVDGALEILLGTSPLPSVCGRVCPGFCMHECNRARFDGAVNVRALERFAGDHGMAKFRPDGKQPQHVAIIGSGPAGLSSAWQLARLGYAATIFEAGPEIGGLMRTGIPEYRLPRDVLDRDIERILDLGVRTNLNSAVDRERLEEISAMYDAVLVATGLQKLTAMQLGLDMKSVMQGIQFLDLARTGAVSVKDETVIVVGGGNTAIDAARSAHRLGARHVRIVYRRTRAEMPAIAEEVEEAIDEGIDIGFLCSPLSLEERGDRGSLLCQRMQLGKPDDSGRRRPVPLPGSEFEIICDRVILALGQKADLSLFPESARPGAGMTADGQNNDHGAIYAAGDVLTNEGTVTAAIGCGRDLALRLHEAFSGERVAGDRPTEQTVVRSDQLRMQHFERAQAHHEAVLPLIARRGSFEEVNKGLYSAEEARRCLSCGVCTACDRCVTYCPDGVVRRAGAQIVFDYDYCKGCGICVTECPRAVILMKSEPLQKAG